MEVEVQPPPKPIEVTYERSLWVAIFWPKPEQFGTPLPHTLYAHDKADLLKWVRENTYRDPRPPGEALQAGLLT